MSSATTALTEAAPVAGSDILVDGEEIPAEARGFSAALFAAFAATFIALTPIATRVAPLQKGWWVEPRTWPLLCLGIVLVAALWQVVRWVPAGPAHASSGGVSNGFWGRSLWAVGGMLTALEFTAYFCVYVFAMTYFGFALASLAFLQFMTVRAGLYEWKWRWIGLAFIIVLVLVFRKGLSIYFPLAPFYQQFTPAWFQNTIAIYL